MDGLGGGGSSRAATTPRDSLCAGNPAGQRHRVSSAARRHLQESEEGRREVKGSTDSVLTVQRHGPKTVKEGGPWPFVPFEGRAPPDRAPPRAYLHRAALARPDPHSSRRRRAAAVRAEGRRGPSEKWREGVDDHGGQLRPRHLAAHTVV